MSRHITTFCRVCEAECGIIATVEDERVVDVRADPDSPHSQGFMCTKPRALMEIVEDPDRVLRPLRRTGGPGEFSPVSWDEALEDIASRLSAIVGRDGPKAFATHTGNPAAFDASGTLALMGLRTAIGSPWSYGLNGEDASSFCAAAGLQLGSTALFLRPDIWRTDFLLMCGANPWISKGSVISEPQIRKAMNGVVERGGRVVVVDPRRTETARHFQHVPIRPGTDAWLVLALLRIVFDEGLANRDVIASTTMGSATLEELLRRVDVEDCSQRTGIPEATLRDIAVAFGRASAAVMYGRTGFCTQRFGTLNNMLLNALNTVTGNVNRPGGAMFGYGALDLPKLARSNGSNAYGQVRTRTLGLPATFGMLPTQSLWRDITEPGPDRIRALVMMSANPVLSSGAGGERLASALQQLDLHVSLDLYVNETNRYADYILPGTTMYERPDVPLLGLALQVRPSLYATERVIAPRGEAREEWRVMNEIARRMGLGGAYPVAPLRWLARLGYELPPIKLYDAAIRTGPFGDWFGLRRRGWSIGRLLRERPSGVGLMDRLPVQRLEKLLETPERRIRLTPPELIAEFERLLTARDDPDFPLRAIGMRELRSHNSWMHNSPRLVSDSRRPAVRVHPDDARAVGVAADGDELVIESATGTITMPVELTEDVARGTIAVPHGWGHHGGWQRANRAGGANANALASTEIGDIEPLAGMSILSGIPIRIRAAVPAKETESSLT